MYLVVYRQIPRKQEAWKKNIPGGQVSMAAHISKPPCIGRLTFETKSSSASLIPKAPSP
jgi:hypothetical protein